MIEGWLSQLKVQNKYIRRQAENVTISFDNDPDMAFEVLEKLHKEKVNLANDKRRAGSARVWHSLHNQRGD